MPFQNYYYMKHIVICLAFILTLSACKKDIIESTDPGELTVEFDNIVGGQNLQLNTGTYTNSSGESFSIDLLQYYISNIQLVKADGNIYTVPQDSSYFLIKEQDVTTHKAKLKVPGGEYVGLRFVLGVDSLRNTMDITKRTGVLDPSGGMSNGMYWSWNSGYIFFKMEGLSTFAPADPNGNKKIRYHIGGFGGYSSPTINNIKTIQLDLKTAGTAKVSATKRTNIHLLVDIAKMFTGTKDISIAANSTVMFGAVSTDIANNYTSMFRHDHTEN